MSVHNYQRRLFRINDVKNFTNFCFPFGIAVDNLFLLVFIRQNNDLRSFEAKNSESDYLIPVTIQLCLNVAILATISAVMLWCSAAALNKEPGL